MWYSTAALVVEMVSPQDATWQKLPFYAAHGVDEVLMVDRDDRSVQWLARAGEEYREIERSGLVGRAATSSPSGSSGRRRRGRGFRRSQVGNSCDRIWEEPRDRRQRRPGAERGCAR